MTRDQDMGVLTFLDLEKCSTNNKQLTLTLNDSHTSALTCAPYPSRTSVSSLILTLAAAAEFVFVGLRLSPVYYSTTHIFACMLEKLPMLEGLHEVRTWLLLIFSISASATRWISFFLVSNEIHSIAVLPPYDLSASRPAEPRHLKTRPFPSTWQRQPYSA